MILLDTHIWVWWVHGAKELGPSQVALLEKEEKNGLGLSIISCWEVAKLVECNRLVLSHELSQWLQQALAYPGIQLLPLTTEICLESTRLPENFHKDPADQLIVATARNLSLPLLTSDRKIQKYPHVETIK